MMILPPKRLGFTLFIAFSGVFTSFILCSRRHVLNIFSLFIFIHSFFFTLLYFTLTLKDSCTTNSQRDSRIECNSRGDSTTNKTKSTLRHFLEIHAVVSSTASFYQSFQVLLHFFYTTRLPILSNIP